MSKKNKKNQKKVQAKINNTPAKAEAAKKEESKSANNTVENIQKRREADKEKAKKNAELKAAKKKAKKLKEEKKYAASKARIEARKARKKSIMDKLIDSKKTKAPTVVKMALEERKKKQEERRKTAEARHIASITRRCSRMKLDEATTKKVVDAAKKQWNSATVYDIVVVCDSALKKRKEIEKLVKDCGIKAASITNSTAFLKGVPKSAVEKLRELIGNATFYQYRTDGVSPFDAAGVPTETVKIKQPKKGGAPHSIACYKSRNINGYNLRKLKKAKKAAEKAKTKDEAKPVNKKPTQVKSIKSKSVKQAA